ncbi:MAG: NAD-dependent epimerase/dehydratase family protein [Myxococcales bacterium]|nr:NAD-dependent epimerase/dehydratase family protein [Myxococcales bacterium]
MSAQTIQETANTDGHHPVLVTGGTGFLGEHVLRALRQNGQSVRVLVRKPTPTLKELGVSQYSGDVLPASLAAGTDAAPARGATEDVVSDDLLAALDGCRQVYHLAGLVSRDPHKAQDMMRLHVEGTRHLLYAAKRAGVRRVVLASTSGTIAVSREAAPIPDETWPYPVELVGNWPYYLSKIYQEKLALDLGARLGLEIVCVNPSLLLGPGDRRGSSTEDVRKFLCGEIAAIPSGGLSFVDVRDAARACVAAMHKGRPGARYLLGGPNWTFAEFLGRLGRIAKVEGPWLRVPAGWNSWLNRITRAVDHVYQHRGETSPVDRVSFELGQVFWYCDSSLARAELGFSCRDPGETLDETIRDVRSTLRY